VTRPTRARNHVHGDDRVAIGARRAEDVSVSRSPLNPDPTAPAHTREDDSREPVNAVAPRPVHDGPWLDIGKVADVTITCSGRRVSPAPGAWTAHAPGEQLIDVRFRQPTAVRRIRIVSSEAERSRTQEMTIWASLLRGERHREVVRQQFNFSPGGATRQIEDYAVELNDVSSIQLRIVPSIDGTPATASVEELRIATSGKADAPA
jgi:hypothetical protein